MEDIRRVMRPQVMFNVRQQSRGLIACRLDHLTVEPHQGLRHQLLPGVLIACLGRLLQENVVAHGVYAHQAQTACKGFILRHRDVFGWHLVRQACAFLAAVRHDGLFHTTVDLLLHAVGSADKPIKARDPQEQTHKTNPTGSHFGVDQVERHN